LVIIIFLFGCVSIPTEPFDEFSLAIEEAKEGVELVLSKNYDWERKIFIEDVLSGERQLAEIEIQRKGSFQYAFAEAKPLFFTLQDVKVTLSGVNNAVVQYANLLKVLASPELINKEEFEELTKNTESALNGSLKSLQIKTRAEAIPIFSISALELSRLVIENRRKKALENILDRNQASMEEYTNRCIVLIDNLEKSLFHAYGKAFANLEDEYSRISGNGTIERRKEIIEQALELNEEYISSVNGLKEACKVYENLPKAHKELQKSVKNEDINLQMIKDIHVSAKRLQRIYSEMAETGGTVGD